MRLEGGLQVSWSVLGTAQLSWSRLGVSWGRLAGILTLSWSRLGDRQEVD